VSHATRSGELLPHADERELVPIGVSVLTFAPLRLCVRFFFVSCHSCLQGVIMVLRTFRYGFYKPAYADKSG
jgi:hypothetical protein